MNLLGASNLFVNAMNIYKQLKYIKANKIQEPGMVKNIYNLETQYDELLEHLEGLYAFSNTKENVAKLQSFVLRYGEKIKNEYGRTRSLVEGDVGYAEDIEIRVKPMKFEVSKEKKEGLGVKRDA